MTNEQILQIAMEQSAIDANCKVEDFLKTENVITTSVPNPQARKYLKLPLPCDLISYGTNIVANIDSQYEELVNAYINKYEMVHCFETPNLQVLNDAFRPYEMQVCFQAEYFLPDLNKLPCSGDGFPKEFPYELRIMEQGEFKELYLPEWSNALCEDRKQLDVLGIGAYDGDRLVGLAACSADCDTMWQIGIDVLTEYRRQNIATTLTTRLTQEILKRGKVPFYCAAWSNIRSVRNAIKSGFRPAWVQLTVKPTEFVQKMNQ